MKFVSFTLTSNVLGAILRRDEFPNVLIQNATAVSATDGELAAALSIRLPTDNSVVLVLDKSPSQPKTALGGEFVIAPDVPRQKQLGASEQEPLSSADKEDDAYVIAIGAKEEAPTVFVTTGNRTIITDSNENSEKIDMRNLKNRPLLRGDASVAVDAEGNVKEVVMSRRGTARRW